MAINRTSPKKGKVVDIPTAPTIGTATAGAESATIAFTAATVGGPVATYTALSSPGSITGTGSSSPVTVSGLTAGTSYTFTVRGNNATGSGEYSVASNSITPTVATSYESIATVTVGAGGSSSISFSSIPSTFKHLQVRGIHKQSATGAWATIELNSDTTAANYTYHRLYGDGSAAAAESNASLNRIFTSYPHWGSIVIDVLDYTNTNKYTTVRTLSGWDGNGSGEVNYISNLWENTAAVSTLTINLSSFVQYSHFALYGIKG